MNRIPAAVIFGVLTVPATAWAQEERANWLDVEVGKSVVLELDRTPSALAVTDPNVANPMQLAVGNRFQIQGVKIGTTDLVVQYGAGMPAETYEITVHRDLSDLVRRIDSIVEGEPPRVYPLGERIVVEGDVDDLDTLEQVALVSRIYDEEFVNLMKVRGDHQVQLEVVFAEVSRSAARELGLNIIYGDQTFGAALTAPTSGNNVLSALEQFGGSSPLTNTAVTAPGTGFILTAFGQGFPVSAVMSILDDYKLGKILAQPTLVSLSGQQSEFLSGGEIPIPTPQAGGAAGAGATITITYKEYGINLVFVPTVLADDVVDIRMTMEVSELDYANAARIGTGSVPGLLTRRSKSHVRIQSGMTFAVAGLMNDRTRYLRASVPGLGKIPLIGALFRTVQHSREETEAVVYVTPRLVRPLAAGEVPAAPGTTENNNPSDFELYLLGVDHRPGSRTVSPTGAVGLQR